MHVRRPFFHFCFFLSLSSALLAAARADELLSGQAQANDNAIDLGELAVEATVIKNSVTAERKQASVSVDVLTADFFARFTGGDVSDLIVRVPGLSVTSRGSFAVVRGLAERYNPVMLDGIVLPSADPERQSPQLDLFPAKLVDAIIVSKSFEASLPATSSGGAIDLRSRPLPEGKSGKIQIGISVEQDALDDAGFFGSGNETHHDWLAEGTKGRAGAPASAAQFLARIKTKQQPLLPQSSSFPMGRSYAFNYENRLWLNREKEHALGFALMVNHDESYGSEHGEKLGIEDSIFTGSATAAKTGKISGHTGFTSANYEEFSRKVRLGLFASLGLALGREHTIGASAFLSRTGKDEVNISTKGIKTPDDYATLLILRDGFSAENADPSLVDHLDSTLGSLTNSIEMHYLQRQLSSLRLFGEHQLDLAGLLKLRWALADVASEQEEPDYSILPYEYRVIQKRYVLPFINAARPLTRYWRRTEEQTQVKRFDVEREWILSFLPQPLKVRAGLYDEGTRRDFTESSFSLRRGGGLLQATSLAGLVDTIANDVATKSGYTGLKLSPFASARRDAVATYLSAAVPLFVNKPWIKKLEFNASVRHDDFDLTSRGRGEIGNFKSNGFYGDLTRALGAPQSYPVSQIFTGAINSRRYYPAFGLTWTPRSRLNVRLNHSRTVARPSFREMGPYFTVDEVSDELQHGNVFLDESHVRSTDLRIEYFFPRSQDLVAFSAFAKDISHPIERVYFRSLDLGPVATWINNPGAATVRGIEGEFSKALDFLGPVGEWFTLGGNGTLLDATVARHPVFEKNQIAVARIGAERPLYDQPKWIANGYVTFRHQRAGFMCTLGYTAVSDVLRSINDISWDTYAQGHGRWDLSVRQDFLKRWTLQVAVRNLTDPGRRFIGDPHATTEEVVYRTFHDGRGYSLSLSRNF